MIPDQPHPPLTRILFGLLRQHPPLTPNVPLIFHPPTPTLLLGYKFLLAYVVLSTDSGSTLKNINYYKGLPGANTRFVENRKEK